jgi:hypothetical protein
MKQSSAFHDHLGIKLNNVTDIYESSSTLSRTFMSLTQHCHGHLLVKHSFVTDI